MTCRIPDSLRGTNLHWTQGPSRKPINEANGRSVGLEGLFVVLDAIDSCVLWPHERSIGPEGGFMLFMCVFLQVL